MFVTDANSTVSSAEDTTTTELDPNYTPSTDNDKDGKLFSSSK